MVIVTSVYMVLSVFSLQEMLQEYKSILDGISTVVMPLMKPYKNKVEDELNPGVVSLTWMSLNVDTCKFWLYPQHTNCLFHNNVCLSVYMYVCVYVNVFLFFFCPSKISWDLLYLGFVIWYKH